jgi:hypothetical protein
MIQAGRRPRRRPTWRAVHSAIPSQKSNPTLDSTTTSREYISRISKSIMSDLSFCQYAFALPDCRVQEIGPGVDPHYRVELLCEGPIAAVISRVNLDEFSPERLEGCTPEDMQWLDRIAVRHNEIICQAARSSAVLPLRLGTVFRSRDSLLAALVRCQSAVAKFLKQIGNRQEWEVKLYLEKRRPEPVPGHNGPPAPHFLRRRRETGESSDDQALSANERWAEFAATPQSPKRGIAYLTRKMADLDGRRELHAGLDQMIQIVEQRLANRAERYCRIRNLPSDQTGHSQQMVFNAAFLLPPSSQASWLETIQSVDRDIQRKGLLLEASGPSPPYHFCPSLEP